MPFNVKQTGLQPGMIVSLEQLNENPCAWILPDKKIKQPVAAKSFSSFCLIKSGQLSRVILVSLTGRQVNQNIRSGVARKA